MKKLDVGNLEIKTLINIFIVVIVLTIITAHNGSKVEEVINEVFDNEYEEIDISDLEDRYNYHGYSRLDMYKNNSLNKVPIYVKKKKIKKEDGFLYNLPSLSTHNKRYDSKVSVNKNKLGFQYKLIVDAGEDDLDVLDLGLMSYNKKMVAVYGVERVKDGYIVFIENEDYNYTIEKIDDNYSYVWSYEVNNPNDFESVDSFDEVVEYKNKYFILMNYTSTTGNSYYVFSLSNDGKLLTEDFCDDSTYAYTDYKNSRIYLNNLSVYEYIDLETGKVEKINKKISIADGYGEYELFETNDKNTYYFGEIVEDEAGDENGVLIKTNKNGDIEKQVDLRKLTKVDLNDEKLNLIEAKYENNHILVYYSISDIDDNYYEGLLFMDDNFNIIKILTTKNEESTEKELKYGAGSITDFRYDNNLYVIYALNEGRVLAKYDSNGNEIFARIYDDMTVGDGGLVVFNDKEILDYDSFIYGKTLYLKMMKVTIKE